MSFANDRGEVLRIIDAEREYQDQKFGDKVYPTSHYLLDFEVLLNAAKQAHYDLNEGAVKEQIRKIGALAVKYGEAHGLPERK